MKNRTNLAKYRLWAPIYDPIMGNRLFTGARKRAFSFLSIKSGQKILLVGVGTGEDLYYLPTDIEVMGIDLSDDMLNKARIKAGGREIQLIPMNAEQLAFPDSFFDVVILSLILSVVENPVTAMSEAVRVLKPGGQILVFDKFMNAGEKPNILRRMLNVLTSLAGTDITRRFEEISLGLNLNIVRREDSIFSGNYQIILAEKGPQLTNH